MEVSLKHRVAGYLKTAEQAERDYKSALAKAVSAKEAVDKCSAEQELCVKALQAIKDIRPLLAASSVEKAESLANYALQTIFQTSDRLKFVDEDQRFMIETEEGDTDLIAGNGGGYLAVISFIFQVFLIMKAKARLFMIMDEAFTQLSDEALQRFIDFLRTMCESMEMDVLLITHDVRIETGDVDNAYLVVGGQVKKIK